jgi:hypothetical protein
VTFDTLCEEGAFSGCDLIKRRNTSFANKLRKWLSWETLPQHAKAAVGILCKAREKANGSFDISARNLYLGLLASGVAGPETCLSGFFGKGDFFFATSSALGEGSDFSRCKALMFATARAVCAKPWARSWLRQAQGTSKKQARIVPRIQLAVRSVFRIIGADYNPVG